MGLLQRFVELFLQVFGMPHVLDPGFPKHRSFLATVLREDGYFFPVWDCRLLLRGFRWRAPRCSMLRL
ncbi:hypothetical protein GMST_42910 [Geomonas silvestris]|uniref:Uncharacterized protein n=1 Tax=Geomonas silvestris TaxID=2740184 RepID=A0A6V8MPH7_9BACT|nr:hypothetical protein GMST_42910 [Geomonas silvestris]